MVNTFLLIDFNPKIHKNRKEYIRECLSYLDTRRLGKQRVEAMQIYDLLQDHRFFSNLFSVPYKLENIPLLIEKYNQLKKEGKQYFFNKVESKYELLTLEEYNKDKGKYRYAYYHHKIHPALLMWFGYENALGFYINASIDEWVKRKTKSGRNCVNNMKEVSLPYKIKFPHWIKDNKVSSSHRVAMIRKEIARNEPSWYLPLFSSSPLSSPLNEGIEGKGKEKWKFDECWVKVGYYWPYIIRENKITYDSYSDYQEDFHVISKDSSKNKLYEEIIKSLIK